MRTMSIDMPTVRKFLLGGLLTGLSGASLLNFIHYLNELQKEKKWRSEIGTDDNTIVLTLPSSRLRKTASAGWPTMTAAALSGLAGLSGGVILGDMIYSKIITKKLKKELEAAKHEYLDLLDSDREKKAHVLPFFDNFINIGNGLEKQASVISFPLAAVALLSILGASGAAYITKKVLDERFGESASSHLKGPHQIPRIIIRSADDVDEGSPNKSRMKKTAEFELNDVFLKSLAGGLLVIMDSLSHSPRFCTLDSVKQALDKYEESPDSLIKMAANPPDLLQYLAGRPDVRDTLYKAYVDFKFNSPFLRNVALAANKFFLTRPLIHGFISRYLSGLSPVKSASAIKKSNGMQDLGSLLLLFRVSELLKNPEDVVKDELLSTQEKTKELDDKNKESDQNKPSVQIIAKGDKAVQFLQKNKDKISKAVYYIAKKKQL